MIRLDATTRISLVQVSLATTILMCVLALGVAPDHRQSALAGRVDFAESLAAAVATMTNPDEENFEQARAFLDWAVRRRTDLQSAGLRRVDGQLPIVIGDHAKWSLAPEGASSDREIRVPIFSQAQQETCWGQVELRFTPLYATTWLGIALEHPWVRLSLLMSLGLFGAYAWYLRKILDPTQAVPKRVRTAYDFLAGGLVALDRHERILLCNRAMREILGVSRSQLMGKSLSELPWQASTDGTWNPETDFPWQRAIRTQDADLGRTLQVASHAGIRTLMVNAAPVIGHDNSLRGVMVGFEDITPLEETKAELEKSRASAEAANVAKSVFLANMSHEIRTPMNAILGFADLLRRGYFEDSHEQQEYLRLIHSSGEHLLTIINDILDLSKVEAGRMQVESIECEPFKIVHDVCMTLRMAAEYRGITLTYEVVDRIPRTIRSDPVRFRQVVTNLVNNAIKFTEQGGVRIVLHFVDDPEFPRLGVDVIDSGIGIAADAIDRVFDPFRQADDSTTRQYGGTGLGLSISRRLTELMGGGLSASSEPGCGSTFKAEFATGDLSHGDWLDAATALAGLVPAMESRPATAVLTGLRVLLVDDGESNRKLIRLVLERAGAVVTTAVNGAEAVALSEKKTFDAILMDMQMPVMDGYTATGLIRQKLPDLPIVAMTAHAMKEYEVRCLEAGCSHFLPKPIHIDRLLELMLTYCDPSLAPMQAVEDESIRHRGSSSSPPSVSAGPLRCSLPLDDDEFLEIAREFVTRFREQLRTMASMLFEDNFVELARLAHWLKGAGGTAGFHALTEPARELELAAKEANRHRCEVGLGELILLAERIELPQPTSSRNADAPQEALVGEARCMGFSYL